MDAVVEFTSVILLQHIRDLYIQLPIQTSIHNLLNVSFESPKYPKYPAAQTGNVDFDLNWQSESILKLDWLASGQI